MSYSDFEASFAAAAAAAAAAVAAAGAAHSPTELAGLGGGAGSIRGGTPLYPGLERAEAEPT